MSLLAHSLYVKAIHGGKNKNNRIDSEKLAHLLRSNLIPLADAPREQPGLAIYARISGVY
jgi:hypothetical protein